MMVIEQDRRREWEMNRLTELLLTGYTWRKVRDFMHLSKHDFDVLLDRAVGRARRERQRIETELPDLH
jgi:hypothetical protein